MGNNQSHYSPAEIDRIAEWLRDGDSAAMIAQSLSRVRGEKVSRNAIIGVVHRNKTLKEIGFQRAGHRGGSRKPAATKQEMRLRVARQAASLGPHAAEKVRAATHPAYLPGRALVHEIGEHAPDPSVAFLFAPPPPARPRPVVSPAAYDAGSRRVPLLELRACECRFPVNDAAPGESHLFCGEATGLAESYCAHHAARCGAGYASARRAA